MKTVLVKSDEVIKYEVSLLYLFEVLIMHDLYIFLHDIYDNVAS